MDSLSNWVGKILISSVIFDWGFKGEMTLIPYFVSVFLNGKYYIAKKQKVQAFTHILSFRLINKVKNEKIDENFV